MVLVSFLGVAINAYLSPVMIMDATNGRCHMGIPGKASIPFMTVDIIVDVALTAVFFWLLRPVVKTQGLSTVSEIVGMNTSSLQSRMRQLTANEREGTKKKRWCRKVSRFSYWKSLIGSGLIMLPTVANVIQFYIMKGHELALVCLTICTMDGKPSRTYSHVQ